MSKSKTYAARTYRALQDAEHGVAAKEEAERKKRQEMSKSAFNAERDKAEANMSKHCAKYDAVYKAWPDSTFAALQAAHASLAARVGRKPQLDQPNPWLQQNPEITPDSIHYLTKVLRVFKGTDDTGASLDNIPPMKRVAAGIERIIAMAGTALAGVKFSTGPLKEKGRIMEKKRQCDGRYDRIRDYGRGMVEVLDMNCFPALIAGFETAQEFVVVRIKHRLDPAYDAKVESAGYRDYQLVLRTPDGWLVEVQIIPAEMLKLKSALGHADYTEYRFFLEVARRPEVLRNHPEQMKMARSHNLWSQPETSNLRMAVKLPDSCDLNGWLADYVVECLYRMKRVYGHVAPSDVCTTKSCPTMSGGPQYEYHWADGEKYKTPTPLPAPVYIGLLFDWAEALINDESVFPSDRGSPFPERFLPTVKQLYRRLYRVFVHVYHHHFDHMHQFGFVTHVNRTFKHFHNFVEEFNLMDPKELEPLRSLFRDLCKP